MVSEYYGKFFLYFLCLFGAYFCANPNNLFVFVYTSTKKGGLLAVVLIALQKSCSDRRDGMSRNILNIPKHTQCSTLKKYSFLISELN